MRLKDRQISDLDLSDPIDVVILRLQTYKNDLEKRGATDIEVYVGYGESPVLRYKSPMTPEEIEREERTTKSERDRRRAEYNKLKEEFEPEAVSFVVFDLQQRGTCKECNTPYQELNAKLACVDCWHKTIKDQFPFTCKTNGIWKAYISLDAMPIPVGNW